MNKEILKSLSAFSGFSDKVLSKITEVMKQGKANPEEVIFSEGEPSQELYIIYSGEAKILKKLSDGVEKVLSVVGDKTIIGEMSLFSDKPRTATLKAKTEVKYFSIVRSELIELFGLDPQGARKFLEWLLLSTLERLEHTSRELATVYETSKIITKNLSLENFCQEIIRLLCYSLPDVDTGAIYVWNEFTEEYELTGECKQDIPERIIEVPRRSNISKDDKLLSVISSKTETLLLSEKLCEQIEIFNLKSALIAPIIGKGLASTPPLVGFIIIGNSKETVLYPQHTLDLLNSVAYQLTGAIENIKIEQEKAAKERFDRTHDKTIRW